MFEASISRYMFDLGIGDHHWFSEFQKLDYEAPIGFYSMSELSQELLYNSFDYSFIMQKRRDNYKYLSERLGHIALFPGDIPDNVTPLGYPVLLEDRDKIRSGLFAIDVFPPIYWDIDEIVPARFRSSHKLSDMIMTLPCNQRYNLTDMEYISYSIIKLMSDTTI
jgi:hypothetical protein